MAKYLVEVGGFVTVFRHRRLMVYAGSEAEAADKAEERFVALQNLHGECEQGQIDSVTELAD